jgi:hypothetical protein
MATAQRLQTYPTKPRVFILASSSPAPSLCRYLLYANQFTTEGIVACTSVFQKNAVDTHSLHGVIDAYERCVDNLNAHVHPDHGYPPASHLRTVVKRGATTYGMTAVGDSIPLSEGSQLLYDRILAPSLQPLWVLCWGGTNTLAATLLKMDEAFSPEDSQRLLSRLRVYAISDQDDTGAWIRTNFPDIFYIASVHGWGQYGMAAWTGMSGEEFYGFDRGGPDSGIISKSWIKENVQRGPLGAAYMDSVNGIPEADTPTFLYLIQNGLGVSNSPSYGSWGGRYILTDISTAGTNSNHYSDAVDTVLGRDGRTYTSNHATIWRWRTAFQCDFATRMRWSTTPALSEANHHPVISINNDAGLHPLRLEAEAGETITLDASASYDPDGPRDKLTFRWSHYREPSATQWDVDGEVAALGIRPVDDEQRKVQVTVPPAEKCAVDLESREAVVKGQLLHLILQLTDSGNGSPWPCTTYRRVLIQVTNKDLKGGKRSVKAGGKAMAASTR